MSSKSLSPEQNRQIRELLRQLCAEAGTITKLAERLRVSQPLVSDVLAERKGGGGKLLSGLSRIRPDAVAAILGGAREPVMAPTPTTPTESGGETEAARGIGAIDEVMEILTSAGFPYRDAKAAISAVKAYSEARGSVRGMEPPEVARLASGLLQVVFRDDAAVRARRELLSNAEEFSKRRRGTRKRRARE